MLSKNQIKEIQSLQLKKFRDAKRLFIAEGLKTVSELIVHAPELVSEIYATGDFLRSNAAMFTKVNSKCTEVTEPELKKISLQSTPSGVLAVSRYFDEQQPKFDFENNFAFYLDDVRDPGNMGTIIRVADWFGVPAVFCSPDSCDLYNPKVIQSTMGAFLRVHIYYLALGDLIVSNKIKTVYGAVLNGSNLYKEDLKNGLIVIGNEANGISEINLNHVTQKLTIPANQGNGTESLNAAMATSILASEFFRQLKLAD